ncbi:PIN domain-containing protein [Halocatena marina]|uniref:PIN domain-containing protein n=1 Tax=Halocatena marina TaxID=2934937 RepID=UPI00200F2026|nr:PIN domain-containing protein [Halocatena marina]
MKIKRRQLSVLLNALHNEGLNRIFITHPSDHFGPLVEFSLTDPTESEIYFKTRNDEYSTYRGDVDREHGSPAVDDLPSVHAYRNCFVAAGVLGLVNREEVNTFLDRHGTPDLNAGHRPVFAGFDTNLLPWRIADVLSIRQRGYWGYKPTVNGFALATGVRDELDWDYKHSNTRPLEKAFGSAFSRVFNQPSGANRQGRLGMIHYRQIRDHQYADELVTEKGDEAIVTGYEEYQQSERKDVILFSNDRNFIERAQSCRILAQHIEFPHTLPRKTTASWDELADMIYMLAILFGVIKLPKVSVYGIWAGKEGQDWRNERLKLECRSPNVEPYLERSLSIISQYVELKEEMNK